MKGTTRLEWRVRTNTVRLKGELASLRLAAAVNLPAKTLVEIRRELVSNSTDFANLTFIPLSIRIPICWKVLN